MFIFRCLILSINLFIFKLFDVKSCLLQTEENGCLWTYGHTHVLSVGFLNSPRKMMICYLRDINKFLSYHTLCTSMLTCGLPTKGIELTPFILFEVFGVPQLWDTWCRPFWKAQYEDLRNISETMEKEILGCLISWRGFVFVLNIGYFPFFDGISLYWWKHRKHSGS